MENLELFQQKMKIYNMDAYIVPTGDFHNSEYVSDFFKAREFLSGFTGSAGTLLVTLDKCYLWTDGRYFIQAAKELEGSGIELKKMGVDETMEDFLKSYMADKKTLAFDGRLLPANQVKKLEASLPGIKLVSDIDLVSHVWTKRPKLPFSLLYKLDTFFSGRSYQEKLQDILNKMHELNADCHIISSLEDQAWLYNIRGNDVKHTPVFLAFTIITDEHVTLYVDNTKIDYSIDKYLNECQIQVKSYFDIYEAAKLLKGKRILMDLNKVNYQLYSSLASGNTIIDDKDPSLLLKAIKNPVEIENIKQAHIKDGIAMARFMHFLKEEYKNGAPITEISASTALENFRRTDKGFVDLSFTTIAGWNEHSAMMHYTATKDSDVQIEGNGFLLVDSGGHYLEGTTDITRTYAFGEITEEMKLHYTTVLKSVIRLSTAVFLEGCTGQNLDILARGPIWNLCLDYKCGTGHGVGYLLSVHEGPNGFRYKQAPGKNESAVFVPGMVTTNEPGIYLKGKYGIRIENEMLCVHKDTNENGHFLAFETITYAPIDLDAINFDLLNDEELDWLNKYHQTVFDTLSPYFEEDELVWLSELTRKISRTTEEDEFDII